MAQLAIDIYTEIATYAIPIAVVFELGNLIISSILNASLGGRLWLRR